MRQLHEMLWYLTEALALPAAAALHADVRTHRAEVEELTARPADELAALFVGAARARVGELLGRVSDAVRGPGGRDRLGADIMGRDLRRARLRGAGLRGAYLIGAYLIGADLRGVDLGTADLLGTDLRAADVRGADLSRCLFLTQPQVSAARGDAATRIPAAVRRPAHW